MTDRSRLSGCSGDRLLSTSRRVRRAPDVHGSSQRSCWPGAFGVAFTITILSVSRPEIARDLDSDVTTLVWVISGPVMAAALVSATAGKVGDLRGHRKTYLFGTAGAAAFALATAFAWDAGSLIAFRVLGALVGAATGPSSMAIINMLFPPERRSAALGYWSLVVAGGPVVGPRRRRSAGRRLRLADDLRDAGAPVGACVPGGVPGGARDSLSAGREVRRPRSDHSDRRAVRSALRARSRAGPGAGPTPR